MGFGIVFIGPRGGGTDSFGPFTPPDVDSKPVVPIPDHTDPAGPLDFSPPI